MIALAGTSQVRYIIKGDSLTAYTDAENRAIGTLILKGEACEVLYSNCDSITALLLHKDSVRVSQYNELMNQNQIVSKEYINAYNNAKECNEQANKMKNKLTFAKMLVLALSVLLLIK